MKHGNKIRVGSLLLAGCLASPFVPGSTASQQGSDPDNSGGAIEAAATNGSKHEERIEVRLVETDDGPPALGGQDRAWLGVAIEEAQEALAEQLGLDAGVGLVITHVSPGSPAEGAGLRKNDVLAQLEGHPLAHPAQLRRLVQTRKPGDTVKLVFYRGGKRQEVSVTLGKAPVVGTAWGGMDAVSEPLREVHRELRELRLGDAIRDYANSLREHLGRFSSEEARRAQREIERSLEEARKALQEATRNMSNTQPKIQAEIQRSIEQARRAIEATARQLSNVHQSLQAPAEPLRNLLQSEVRVGKDTGLLLRSREGTSRSIAKSDDWGTLLVVGPPLRLTAHDKNGHLVFDGPIETPEERAKVPPELWKRVAPLLDEGPAPPAPPAPPVPRPPPPPPGSGDTV